MNGPKPSQTEALTARKIPIVRARYQRILHLIKPDAVHVLYDGRIVKEGGPELVEQLEEKGYGWIKDEVEAGATA